MPVSDWWARKLVGTPPSTAPSGSTSAPHYSPPPPQAAPQGYTSYDARTGAPVADDGVVAAIARAAEQTGGSRRVKESVGYCPECGGGNFFARRYSESGTPLRAEASPRCFDCGYPLIQAGSAHGGANAARVSGPAQRARQLPPGHNVTVMDGPSAVTYR